MNPDPVTLFGAPYSVYVRAVRLTLAEKGVPYRLQPVDIFAPDGPPTDYLQRHPFGRIPAFQHGEFCLYEAGAIMRYLDEAFAGPALQPSDPAPRARMNQVISILDAYTYRTWVWDLYVERVSNPQQGKAPNEEVIRRALPRAALCLNTLESIMGSAPFLAGRALTLADLHAIPMFAYFIMTPEAQSLLEPHPTLLSWWSRISARPSVRAMAYP